MVKKLQFIKHLARENKHIKRKLKKCEKQIKKDELQEQMNKNMVEINKLKKEVADFLEHVRKNFGKDFITFIDLYYFGNITEISATKEANDSYYGSYFRTTITREAEKWDVRN